jgi:hypothetical protein
MTSHATPFPCQQRGSGLIEVLVLILVMAVGMLAMGKMHTVLLRDGGTAANRAIATSLAQEKLDDLRAFKWINAASSGGEGCGNGIFCFAEIGNNTGGIEGAGGALAIPSGSITIGNTAFLRDWTSVDNTTFKLITVTVSWTDQNGPAEVVLQSAIALDDASITAMGADGSGGPGFPGPKVLHTPGLTPEVVPISIGDADREASRPDPDTTQHGISTVTTFEVVNYNSNDVILGKEEYATVNCTCVQSGNVTGIKGYTPSIDLDNIGELVQKRTGIPKTGGQYNQQPAVCSICCRDHHDASGYRSFDPFRGDASVSGDHSHRFNLSIADAVGADYDEACRLKRINGLWYASTDWQLEALVVQPKSYFANNLTTYQNAVAMAVKNYVSAIDSGYPTTRPTLTIDLGPNKHDPAGTAINISTTTTSVPLEVMARGIYIDHMTEAQIANIKAKIAANDPNVLSLIPFQEVNVTRLAEWASTNTGAATVTSDALTDQTETTYTRGRVVKSSGGGDAYITASIKRSNTGLTASRPIDPHDEQTVDGQVKVSNVGGAPIVTRYLWGQFNFGTNQVSNSHITLPSANQGLSCTKLSRNNIIPATGAICGVNGGCYSCSTSNETWTGHINVIAVTIGAAYLTNYCVTPTPNGGTSPHYSVSTIALSGNRTEYTTTLRFAESLASGTNVRKDISFQACP